MLIVARDPGGKHGRGAVGSARAGRGRQRGGGNDDCPRRGWKLRRDIGVNRFGDLGIESGDLLCRPGFGDFAILPEDEVEDREIGRAHV